MKPKMGDMCEMAGKSAKNGITEGVIWKADSYFFLSDSDRNIFSTAL